MFNSTAHVEALDELGMAAKRCADINPRTTVAHLIFLAWLILFSGHFQSSPVKESLGNSLKRLERKTSKLALL